MVIFPFPEIHIDIEDIALHFLHGLLDMLQSVIGPYLYDVREDSAVHRCGDEVADVRLLIHEILYILCGIFHVERRLAFFRIGVLIDMYQRHAPIGARLHAMFISETQCVVMIVYDIYRHSFVGRRYEMLESAEASDLFFLDFLKNYL